MTSESLQLPHQGAQANQNPDADLANHFSEFMAALNTLF